ncbi:MAG: hypothetical protein ABFS05_10050 [Bacteroidota bacterium]
MSRSNKQIRTYARLSGIAGILIFLISLFVIIFPTLLASEDNPKLTSDAGLLGFLALGYLFAWHRENEGGIMLMFISVVAGLSYFYNPSAMHTWIVMATCIPLFLSGFLFFLYHRLKPKELDQSE